MSICVSDISAMRYWLSDRAIHPSQLKSAPFGECRSLTDRDRLLAAAFFGDEPTPHHLLLCGNSGSTAPAHTVLHHSSHGFPPGSILELQPNLFITAPELTFVRWAISAHPIHVARFGSLLCARFAKDAQGNLIERMPLTNAGALINYVNRCPSIRGSKVARKGLPFVIDNARSPLEIDTSMRLFLPTRLGGCGIGKPLLNVRIDLSGKACDVSDYRYYEVDMLWPEERYAVEYDSVQMHASPSALKHDITKRFALEEMGYTVENVTNAQMSNPAFVVALAARITKAGGKELRIRASDHREKQLKLFEYTRYRDA